MRLDAIDDADPVGLGSDPVAPDGQTESLASLDDVHAGPERAAHGRLRDAVVRQDLELALRGGAAVAAHGREDEGLRAECLQMVHHRPDDDRNVGNAATARSYGHRVAALDGQLRRVHGSPDPRRDVGQAVPGKGLPHPVHQGQRHGRMILRPPGAVNDLDFGGLCP